MFLLLTLLQEELSHVPAPPLSWEYLNQDKGSSSRQQWSP